MPKPELVPENYESAEIAEQKGEMAAVKIREIADVSTAPLAAYAATRSYLPTWARVGFGVVALTKAPATLRKGRNFLRSWLTKDE